MVFQTAPPQPASKARMTCPAVLVGGPEESQNGFGERMPAKVTERSGFWDSNIRSSLFTTQAALEWATVRALPDHHRGLDGGRGRTATSCELRRCCRDSGQR